MEVPLNQHDVRRITGKKVKLITPNNKDDLYISTTKNKDSNFMIYYETKNNNGNRYGHWCGIVVKPIIREVWFFDSYGDFPDDQLENINSNFRKRSNQLNRDIGIFLYYMSTNGYKIRYNDEQLQSFDKKIATCGRYVGYFIKKNVRPEVFADYLMNIADLQNKNTDEIITIITNSML